MSLATPPRFEDVDIATLREPLTEAGRILAERLGAYLRHRHDPVPIKPGECIFEERTAEGKLLLYPLAKKEAAQRGKPSTWAFAPKVDGAGAEVVVLRYAEHELHEAIDLDVMSPAFVADLQELGDAFVEAGIHEAVEPTIIGQLFPVPEGYVTLECMIGNRRQMLTIIPAPPEVLAGGWIVESAACWHFSSAGAPKVTGLCASNHPVELDPPPARRDC